MEKSFHFFWTPKNRGVEICLHLNILNWKSSMNSWFDFLRVTFDLRSMFLANLRNCFWHLKSKEHFRHVRNSFQVFCTIEKRAIIESWWNYYRMFISWMQLDNWLKKPDINNKCTSHWVWKICLKSMSFGWKIYHLLECNCGKSAMI